MSEEQARRLVEEELLPGARFHPRVSVYREVLRDAYRRIIESGVEPSEQLYGILLHILQVYVFRRPWLREEFAKLLVESLTSMGFEEGEAREAASRFMESGDIEPIVELMRRRVEREETERSRVIDPSVVEQRAYAMARRLVVTAAEHFLIDVGII